MLRYGNEKSGMGDVHHPSLECEDPSRGAYPLEDYVSKTVGRTAALAEVRKVGPLSRMNYDFISVPEHMCEGKGVVRIGKGKSRTATRQKRYLLIAPYAGKTVRQMTREMIEQAERLARYIRALKELRENVRKMNKDDYFHNDLTDLNMTYREDLEKAFLIDFEHVDRERVSPQKSSQSTSRSNIHNNNERDPNDESYFVDVSLGFLLSEIQDRLKGIVTMDDLKQFHLLPRSPKRSSPRTRKILRPHSI